MYLVVGLGNPGEEYEHTRHNAGFDTVDCLASSAGARYWKTECGALTAKGSLVGEDVLFAKPQSYMNTSGGPVKQLCAAHGVKPDHRDPPHVDGIDAPLPCPERNRQRHDTLARLLKKGRQKHVGQRKTVRYVRHQPGQ